MELKIWLVKNRKKIQDFAKELGISRTHLGEIMNGKKKASPTLAKLIEFTTNKEVMAEEILNAYQPKGE